MRATLRQRPTTTPQQETEFFLTRFRCTSCHQRDDHGGIPDERLPYFTTSNINLGDQARLPPALTGVGAKLTPDALEDILRHGHRAGVRPYMHTRMPRFGYDNIANFSWMFLVDELPAVAIQPVVDEKLARNTGAELVGAKGLGCVACHTWDGKSASTLHGLDLTHMASRLQQNWFQHYLRDPQRFHPQTIMPSYWPGGKSVRPEVLDGDTGKQIDAIWQYLSEGRQGRPPAGLTREPIPVVVGEEAVILRRAYPGIGKRGIGVGYPQRVNLSFDAGQMRLASIWRGDFIEASGIWTGQGSGQAHEMSREVIRFPESPAFARLATARAPWPADEAKKADGFQFRGYTLDALRRPTFRYDFAGLHFEDCFLDEPAAGTRPAFLRRTITFSDPAPADLHFLAAADKAVSAEDGNTFLVGKALRLVTDAPAIIRDRGEAKELVVPLAGLPQLTIDYHWP